MSRSTRFQNHSVFLHRVTRCRAEPLQCPSIMMPCRLGFSVLHDLTVCSASLKTATALNRLPLYPHFFNRIQAVCLFILLLRISHCAKNPLPL